MNVPSADDMGVPGAGRDGPPMVAAVAPIALHERRVPYDADSLNGDATAPSGPERKVRSWIMGDAQKITRALIRHAHAFSERDLAFLDLLLAETFHKAGWHVNAGGDEASCEMALHAWAEWLGWRAPNICNIRARLVALGVIWWIPNPDAPGKGRIGWNLTLDEWLPLQADYRQARYARPRAPGGATQAAITSLTAQDALLPQTGNEVASNGKRQPATSAVKLVTLRLPKAASGAAPRERLRIHTEKEAFKNPSPTGDGGAAHAGAAPAADAKPRPVNPWWDALWELFPHHRPVTRPECGNWGKIVRDLKAVHATPDEMRRRHANYLARYGLDMLTPNALVTHWSESAQPPPASRGKRGAPLRRASPHGAHGVGCNDDWGVGA